MNKLVHNPFAGFGGRAPSRASEEAEPWAFAGAAPAPGASAEAIAGEVEALIRSGRLGAGERIRERPLARRFGVSRGPVREALRLLQSRGLVRIEPRRGATVFPRSGDDVAELLDIATELVALAVSRAAARRSTDEATALTADAKSLERDAERLDAPDFTERANALLARAMHAARMARLEQFFAEISVKGVAVAFSRAGLLTKQRRVQAARNFTRLADAVAAGDGMRAKKVCQRLCHQNRLAAEAEWSPAIRA